jgi:hypothetical protein
VSWDSWPSIQTWWDKSVDSLRSRRLVKPIRRIKEDKNIVNTSGNISDKGQVNIAMIAGLPRTWYTSNYICIKYNSGTCDKTSSHKSVFGKVMIKHICGGCLKIGKGEDSSHPAYKCKFKEQFFA